MSLGRDESRPQCHAHLHGLLEAVATSASWEKLLLSVAGDTADSGADNIL